MTDHYSPAQQELIDKYPRTMRILCADLCCWCIHRGYRSGCKYNLLPMVVSADPGQVKTCPRMEPWGEHKKQDLIADSRQSLKMDREIGNPLLMELEV